MMNKSFVWNFLLKTSGLTFILFTFLKQDALAVGVDFDGYFRTRGNYHHNLDLTSSQKPQTRAYSDFRFRLNPNFYVTDKIRVKTSFNILDGLVGDAPFRGVAYTNPASSNDPYFAESSDSSDVGQTIPENEMSSWVYGGAKAPDAASSTSDLQAVQMRRAWLEYETDAGVFKAGRMPYQFGLGILGNAGDGVDQEIGSSRDRILFETGLGNYYLIPGAGWLQEGLVDRPADDAYELFFILGRKTSAQEIALYLSYLDQNKAVSAATNGSLVGAKTTYWLLDFYLQNQFRLVNIQAEVALFAGDYLNRDLFAVNAVARGDWQFSPKLSMITEAGLSTGTSAGDIARNDIKTFSFNRDYNISYILFEEALPGGKDLGGDGRPTAPHSGAISNVMYARFNLGYEVASFFEPRFNIVLPIAHKKGPNAGGTFYGVEYDLITLWPLNEYVTGELTFAHFIPGDVYDTVSGGAATALLRASLSMAF